MEDGPHVYKLFEGEVRRPGSFAAELVESISKRWNGGRTSPSADPDTLVAALDAGDYRAVATDIVAATLRFCNNMPCPSGVAPADFLRSQFAENGAFAEPRFNDANYVAVSCSLQLRLWSYLEYGPPDRFILLTILFLADRLGKRLDPKFSRRENLGNEK